MAVWHGVALAGALLALLCLLCAVSLLVQSASRRRWPRDRTTLELLRRLDARLRVRRVSPAPAPAPPEPGRPARPGQHRPNPRKLDPRGLDARGLDARGLDARGLDPRKPGSSERDPSEPISREPDPREPKPRGFSSREPDRSRDPNSEFACIPCPEQIAAELRRLNQMRRHGLATQSDAWLTAVNNAYDRWLCQGCQTLGVSEELRRLDGLDRELERARIEEVLRDKGF